MFNHFERKRIEFFSNPPIHEKVVIDVTTNRDGNPVNIVKVVPGSNRPIYDGLKYDPALMSLRAKLNAGINLKPVFLGAVENDPSVLQETALSFENRLHQRFDELEESVKSQNNQPVIPE